MKRLERILVLAVIVGLGGFMSPLVGSASYLPGAFHFGDYNCDGTVSATDRNLMVQVLSGSTIPFTGCSLLKEYDTMDLDGDGEITDLDKNIISAMILSNYPPVTTGLPGQLVWDVSEASLSIGDTLPITVQVLGPPDAFDGGLPRTGVGVVFSISEGEICSGSTVITLTGLDPSGSTGSSYTDSTVFQYSDDIASGGKATVVLTVPNDSSCNLRTVTIEAYVPSDSAAGLSGHRLANTLTAANDFTLWIGGDVHYVDVEASGSNNGSDWTNAYTSLPTAVSSLSSGEALFVANGVYDLTSVIYMRANTALFGGFIGGENGEKNLGERGDPLVRRTVIKRGASMDNMIYWYYSHATLDGFWMIDGDYTPTAGYGGAAVYLLYNEYNTIRNCVFAHNHSNHDGGAIYGVEADNLVIDNCRFVDNGADSDGGAVYLDDSDNITITGSEFNEYRHEYLNLIDGNSASNSGGAVYMYNSDGENLVEQCTFDNNSSFDVGGLYYNGEVLTISECLFKDNNSGYHAGAAMVGGATDLTVQHSIFTGNYAGKAGALAISGVSNGPIIFNDLFTDNYNWNYNNGGGAISNEFADSEITNCTFDGNYNYYGYDGYAIGNYNSDITVRNSIFNDTQTTGQKILDVGTSTTDNAYSIIRDSSTCSTGCYSSDPYFVSGADPDNSQYLEVYGVEGGSVTSDGVDHGNQSAAAAGLDDRTTRADGAVDTGTVDMGFHDSE